MRKLFSVVQQLLREVSCERGEDGVTASGYLAKLNDWNFVTCLLMFEKIFGVIRILSDQLQAEKIDVPKAIEFVSTLPKIDRLAYYTIEEFGLWSNFR